MINYSQDELDKIINGLLDRSLDKSLWTHHAHIITAIWHLREFDPEDALCRLRSGIITYNFSLGGENTGKAGYHETITVFWWEIAKQFVAKNTNSSFKDACYNFLNSPMADKNFPFQFYTKEKLLSPVARSRFINPDLKEIVI
ncbi:MAG: hypothetical protein WDN26_02115 [Chitinophagaceae bacterium]